MTNELIPGLLSVVIPVYNEARNIKELVSRVQKSNVKKEIILVDDASTDGTKEIIKKEILPFTDNIRLYEHQSNQGKGSGIRTGIRHVTGEWTIIQDADLEYNPAEYPQLVEPLASGKAEVVYGSRFSKVDKRLFIWHWFLNRFFGKHYEIRYLHHFMGIQVLNCLANLLYNARISDEATCYKLFKTNVLRKIKLNCTGFEFCPEVTAKVRKLGFSIYEVPIEYHPRSKKDGKKLNWTHGFEAIWTLIKYRFTN